MKVDPSYQAKWYGIIKELYDSGLAMTEFCSKRNINYYQIQYWKKKYNRRNDIQPKKEFVKVKTNQTYGSSKSFRITYGKVSIELNDSFNEDVLLKILKVADKVV